MNLLDIVTHISSGQWFMIWMFIGIIVAGCGVALSEDEDGLCLLEIILLALIWPYVMGIIIGYLIRDKRKSRKKKEVSNDHSQDLQQED